MKVDDTKALNFFKEFGNFFKDMNGFESKIIFNPIYKYHHSYLLSEEEKKTACVDTHICGQTNPRMDITNPKYVLEESIRQKCIHQTYLFKKGFYSQYWMYMIRFRDDCADEKSPNFTPECSKKVSRISLILDYE